MSKESDQYFLDDDGNVLCMTGNKLEYLPEVREPIPADIQRIVENACKQGIQSLRNAHGALAEFQHTHLAELGENMPEFEELLIGGGSGERLPEFDPTIERIHDPASRAAETDFSDSLSRQIASGEIVVVREDVDIDEVLVKIDSYSKLERTDAFVDFMLDPEAESNGLGGIPSDITMRPVKDLTNR